MSNDKKERDLLTSVAVSVGTALGKVAARIRPNSKPGTEAKQGVPESDQQLPETQVQPQPEPPPLSEQQVENRLKEMRLEVEGKAQHSGHRKKKAGTAKKAGATRKRAPAGKARAGE